MKFVRSGREYLVADGKKKGKRGVEGGEKCVEKGKVQRKEQRKVQIHGEH